MADFKDAADPAFGAAAERLAAWRDRLADDAVVDAASGLSVADLDLVLVHAHRNRRMVSIAYRSMDELAAEFGGRAHAAG